MLFFGFPIIGFLLVIIYLFREVEARTYHVAPWLEANAVRSVLNDLNLREVKNPDEATIVWSDTEKSASGSTDSGQRKRRVSTLRGA